jgi:hypothetical protein
LEVIDEELLDIPADQRSNTFKIRMAVQRMKVQGNEIEKQKNGFLERFV